MQVSELINALQKFNPEEDVAVQLADVSDDYEYEAGDVLVTVRVNSSNLTDGIAILVEPDE